MASHMNIVTETHAVSIIERPRRKSHCVRSLRMKTNGKRYTLYTENPNATEIRSVYMSNREKNISKEARLCFLP